MGRSAGARPAVPVKNIARPGRGFEVNATQPRVRRSITELQDDYASGNKKPLQDLWRAFKGIQELPPDHPDSFFRLAGYHGEPFRGAGWGSSKYWGGYCNHGNVLFPTWHRVYLLKLEQALQRVEGCADVMLPYWDETSEESREHGIPWALTQYSVELGDETIDNPLRSFRLNANIKDHVQDDVADYSKRAGYETQRYPRSGLVGTDADRAKTDKHNHKYEDYDYCVKLLNDNIGVWLKDFITIHGKKTTQGQVAKMYRQSLAAPNYTVFSNRTSASAWNDNNPAVMSLEKPHDSIHLAVGGFEVPGQRDSSPISGANGDMGENDTSSFDPIFFFHHCFVDYVFWRWQQLHGTVEVLAEYPGTNSADGQGATPGVAPNSWLDLDSPLAPFAFDDKRLFTSRDCLDTEKRLGYTYSAGSLSGTDAAAEPSAEPGPVVAVSGINRAPVRGSFLISVFAKVGDERVHLGTEAVLSRWNTQNCANCQTHLEATALVKVPSSGTHPMAALSAAELADRDTYDYEVATRDGILKPAKVHAQVAAAAPADSSPAAPSPLAHARLEVR
jgi:tyrosinase